MCRFFKQESHQVYHFNKIRLKCPYDERNRLKDKKSNRIVDPENVVWSAGDIVASKTGNKEDGDHQRKEISH